MSGPSAAKPRNPQSAGAHSPVPAKSNCLPLSTSLDPDPSIRYDRRIHVTCDTRHFAAAGPQGFDHVQREAKIP